MPFVGRRARCSTACNLPPKRSNIMWIVMSGGHHGHRAVVGRGLTAETLGDSSKEDC